MNINSTAQAFGEIHGKVVDAAGKPIESAQVITMVGSSVVGATTDSLGKFKLKPLSSGIYNLEFRMVGMEKLEYTSVQVNPDKITRLPVVTLHEMGELNTLDIITYKIPLIQVDGGNVTQIQAKELQQMSVSHGGNLKNIAASLTSDIKKSANGEELYFRGSRSGAVIYMIDGVKIRENVPNIPSSGISRMMVYTGGVPAKYGDTTGGVIVIETKSYLELYNEKMASQGN
ncbi:MAG: carboxypeptidase regulatory-like domain-containing protein [Flavobacteriales bacterium]